MLKRLLELPGRTVYLVAGCAGGPAVYYLVDEEVQGILVNAPPFSEALMASLQAAAPLKFIFLPSRLGAQDTDRWRAATGAEVMAYGAEVAHIAGTVDIELEKQSKLTRTIDFLPMSGRTEGACALRLRNKPAAIFFGPILSAASDSGWPTLIPNDDDYSYENRVFGTLGLQDVKYEYAFTDVFEEGRTQFGPGASEAVRDELNRALDLA
ncbi:MAG: hypothetical protein WCC36_14820 [Gammaproteobacteria bacterium]